MSVSSVSRWWRGWAVPRVGALSQEPPAVRGEVIASVMSLVARAAWPPSLLRNAVRVDTPRVSTSCAGLKTAHCDRFSHSCGLRDDPSALPSRTVLASPSGVLCGLRSIAPIWPLRLSPPLACRDASGDESPDTSLQQAGAAIGAVVRHGRGYGRRLMAPYGHPIHH